VSRQFRTLVAHFFGRFFDVDSTSADVDTSARLIQFLALLTVPGLMISFFMLADHPANSMWVRAASSQADRLWLRVGDRYVFVAYAMVVMGLLMTFKWDALFPDRRDYLILTSLPISYRRWFAAKVLALAAFLSLFAIAINAFSLLLVPRQVAEQSKVNSPTVFWQALAAHTAGTIGGSLFAALFFGALQGLLINVLTPNAFRRVSPRIQMVSIAALVIALLLIPLVKDSIPTLAKNESPFLDYFPLMWFLGFYEALIPGGSLMPRSIVWARTAIDATILLIFLFAVSYVIAYRRYSRKILESVESETILSRWFKRCVDAILDRTVLRDPVERGTFHFIEKLSNRSTKHRILTALYVGIGIALALSSYFSRYGPLEAPSILTFVLVSGLRATFNIPCELNANWVFQTTGDENSPRFLKAVRKWVFLYRIVPLFGLIAAFEFKVFVPSTALFHLVFDLILGAVLIEAFFFNFNKVPFTCAYVSNKLQFGLVAVGYLFGFTLYIELATNLKRAITAGSFRMAVFIGVSVAVFTLLRRKHRTPSITYDDDEPGLLSLSTDRGYWKGRRGLLGYE
jgi:hypothetical protein